jgi:hypothetical protein
LTHIKRRIREFDEMKISELNLGKPEWQIGKKDLLGIEFVISKAKNY